MALRVTVENYRGLAGADWTLEPGVSLLVGPNGSGKTTLLEVPALLGDALTRGIAAAVEEHGGRGSVLSLGASADVARLVAKADAYTWQIELRPRGGELGLSDGFLDGDGHVVGEKERPPTALHVALKDYAVRGDYDRRDLRLNGSRATSDKTLWLDGTNVFSVLRNWRDSRATAARGEFVKGALKDAFPDLFEDLEFEAVGQRVAGRFIPPRGSRPLDAYFAPDGLLVGLLHLTSVASAPPGSAMAIDDFENFLHPYAICALLQHIADWATDRGISVTLATHSPVLINQFKVTPERLLVMDRSEEVVPTSLAKLRDPEWLSHFSLGDLYANGNFGAQAPH